ncbi:hypothetical protein ACFE04_009405 [Oxalis oulophora]
MEKNIILAIVCVAFFATQGLAQLLIPPEFPVPGPAQPPSPEYGAPLASGSFQEKMLIPDECVLEKMKFSRCLLEIELLLSKKTAILGYGCCKAVSWPNSSLTPDFSTLLKSLCAKNQ